MSMLRDAWFIARKDLRYMLVQRDTLLWTFVMPILFFYFIGTITAGFGGGDEGPDRLALHAGEDPGFLLERLVGRLEEQDLEVVRVSDAEELASFGRGLTVPAGLTGKVLAGEPSTLELVRRGGGLGGEYDEVRVARAVYTLLADLVVVSEEGANPSEEAFARLDAEPRALTLRVMPAGERLEPPTGFEQAVPGTMVMFTLLVMLTSGAVLLVIERQQGLLRRLASTPISRGSVVLGKWAGKLALGLLQIGFAMLVGSLLFGIGWGESLGMVLAVLIAYAALTAALGLLLGSLARSEGQAVGLGVLAANVLAALGGCWWPIEITPAWMQGFARFLPTGAAMDALHKLVSFGLPATSALPHVTALLLAALLVGWLGARLFRYQ